MRSPGTLEGIVIQEYLIEHVAEESNLDANKVRLQNFHGDTALKKILPDFLKDIGMNSFSCVR